MTAWWIAWKDLKVQFRDVGAVILLFLVPMVVITIASFALGGLFEEGASAVRVPFVDADRSETSREVAAELEKVEGLTLESKIKEREGDRPMTEEHARRLIENGHRSVAIVIPAGFGQMMKAGGQTAFIVLQNPAERMNTTIVRGVLEAYATRLSANAVVLKVAVEEALAATPGLISPEEIARRTSNLSDRLWKDPPVRVRATNVLQVAGRGVDPFKQNVPGYAVMFALFTMLSGGGAFLREKEMGTFRRLLMAPIPRSGILFGKLLPTFVTVLLQMSVFFAFGHLVFGMDLGQSPAGLVLMAVAVAMAATSLSILMAAFVKTEAQLSGASLLVVLAMSSLGGSWWPLEIVPDFMRTLAHIVTINAWAMDGFKDVIWYGRGVRDILPEAGVLLLISVLAFGVGLTRFEFD
jgi:linearmycin/streptolysin S transport system permease protein